MFPTMATTRRNASLRYKIQEDSGVLPLWDKNGLAQTNLMLEKIAEGVTDAYQSPFATRRRGKETSKQKPEVPRRGDA